MARCSSIANVLRDIDSIGCRARNITIQKWEIDNFKIKIGTYIINLVKTISLEIDKWKSKARLRYQRY